MTEAADRILDERDFVSQFRGESDRGFDTGIRSHADHDGLADAMLFHLQVEIRIRKPAR